MPGSIQQGEVTMNTGNENPKVSVIIPCYNGEKFIGEAIESVLNQTYQDFEIIIVDDGSTDNSKDTVEPYLADSRIKLIQHGKNKGIPAARNTGIKASRGEFIAFLDQDDLWLSEKLEKQIATFESRPKDLGWVFSDMLVVDNNDGPTKERWGSRKVPTNISQLSPREVMKALFLYNFISIITVLVRRECIDTIGLLDESIRGGSDDYEFCLRLAVKYKVEYLNMPLAVHRIHEANYSNVERFFRDNLLIMDKVLAQEPFLTVFRKKKLAMLYYSLGRYYQQNEGFHQAKEALWKAIKYRPLQIKPALALLLCHFGHIGNWVLQIYASAKSLYFRTFRTD